MTCCCDPPDIDLAIRGYTLPPDPCTGCTSGAATAIAIPALLGSPGPSFEVFCANPYSVGSGGTVSTTFGNTSYVSQSPSPASPGIQARWNSCSAGVHSITVRILCNPASTSADYTKSGGTDCKGTYTRVGASSVFPASISVS